MSKRKPIRVMVVDDAPLIRQLLIDSLGAQGDMEVVAVAEDGEQALELVRLHNPEVITLDLQMPRMNGLETLEQLLQIAPTPVIIVSSLTQRAADVTLQALDRGAMDYVAKPEGLAEANRVFTEELPAKIRNMAGADVMRVLKYRKSRQQAAETARPFAANSLQTSRLTNGCIAIGVSTGGPPALSSLFATLQPPLPPIVVVQHMPALFTGPFARRLDGISPLEVREAATGDELRPNTVFVAPGGRHLRLKPSNGVVKLEVFDGDPVCGHRPSADLLMKSAAEVYGDRCIGVIMTGMGRDGAAGCKAIRDAGGYVLGQDEATSDVYGMNKAAFVGGGVDEQVALSDLPARITTMVKTRLGSSTASRIARRAPESTTQDEAITVRESTAIAKEPRSGSTLSRSAVFKLQLCVVEDDPAQLRLLVNRLQKICPDHVSLFATSSPREAMEWIEARRVDILVADLVMPEYGGVDLLRELKRRNLCTQVLIMTATADIDSLLTAFELGAVDYLLKPIEPGRLEQLVMEAVDRLTRWRIALAGAFRRSRAGAKV